jgi:arginyl-tRNA synthetase
MQGAQSSGTEASGTTIDSIDSEIERSRAVKSDGGFGYDSTDLAAVKYRIKDLGTYRHAPHIYLYIYLYI